MSILLKDFHTIFQDFNVLKLLPFLIMIFIYRYKLLMDFLYEEVTDMTGKERFYATIERKATDRPAVWMSAPAPSAEKGIYSLYRVDNWHDLQIKAGDDLYAFDIPYDSGYATSIAVAFNWYEKGTNVDPQHRTLTADGCFKDAEELSDLDFFEWPDPALYIDVEECRRRCQRAPRDRATLAQVWSAHFQDTCAAFGMETALMNMVSNPEIYKAVDAKILDFYLKANEIIYEATKGYLDSIIIANDFGSQLGLLISREMIHEFVMPGARKLVEQAHSYGLKVIYHSCGAIYDAIEELIAIGVDAIHPIQATATGMDPGRLKADFGDRVAFCGGVDIQHLLPTGTPKEVQDKVRELRETFPTGLVISPSQGVFLDDVPPENIKAMLEEAEKIY
jgi:uroporphyrinogen decarboxylase